jgi:hypothetical protein
VSRSALQAALFVANGILLAAAGWPVIAGCVLDMTLARAP